ncbi:unnamed protein product [Nesidiocoris tenuis]|uniref:Uncharacterized protein n=1 Tax=Nesidiocoris tenuis TaxID=355587 RepID=A0A6H5GDM7_9HEMI|nr:unnamed protein product [Nesidiocoris tenuis]
MLSMVIPGMVLTLCTKQPEPPPSCAPDCKRKTLVFILQILLALLLKANTDRTGIGNWTRCRHRLIIRYCSSSDPLRAAGLVRHNFGHQAPETEVTFVTLNFTLSIGTGAKEICAQVAGIMRSSVEAEQLVAVAKTKFDELRIQLDGVKRHCKGRDRPLCESIPSRLLEVKFTTKMVRTKNFKIQEINW